MPIYEYRCRNCGYEFDKFLRTFETGDVNCPSCQSVNVEKLLSPPVIRMGKILSGPSSEYSAKSEEIGYYKDKKDYERAAKAAEKAGKSHWEIKDLYRKAGRKTEEAALGR